MGSLTWTDISSCCRGEETDQQRLPWPVPALYLQQAVPTSPSQCHIAGTLVVNRFGHRASNIVITLDSVPHNLLILSKARSQSSSLAFVVESCLVADKVCRLGG